jgi:SAM-dependent methyltransferase
MFSSFDMRAVWQSRPIKLLRRFYRYWLCPIFDPVKALSTMWGYLPYLSDWRRYARMPGAEPLHLIDGHPCLTDRTTTTSFDPHYLYQAVWATERIVRSDVKRHVDIGSDVKFVTMLTTHLPVTFVDIRPLRAKSVNRLTSLGGNLLELPFADGSIASLSCLHVAEHIGLGRYGGLLAPAGTRRVCAELARVLVPGGNLFFSLPVGRSRVCFNAHRVHSPAQILEYFYDLELVEFTAVDDSGHLLTQIPPYQMNDAEHGCGLFWFRRSSGHTVSEGQVLS